MRAVSIVIPVYNVEKYLRKCLDSILVNNAFTGQVVCVNDGSTDGSLSILEQYAVIYPNVEIISQLNSGLSEARNTGLRAAKENYVMFVDSDDWIVSRSLAKLFSCIDGEEVVYYNGRRFFDETQQYESECPIKEFSHQNGQSFFATVSNTHRNIPWVCVWGAVYKRTYLLDNSLWNEPGIYHEDSYFTPQVLLKANDVSCVDIDVYVYRIRTGSITAAVKPKNIKDAIWVNRNLYRTYTTYRAVDKAFYTYLTELYVGIIVDAYANNLELSQYWSLEDVRIMQKGVHNDRSRKIARLAKVSTRLAYRYCTNQLPNFIRRMVNRFL